jgi:hypothetical protein
VFTVTAGGERQRLNSAHFLTTKITKDTKGSDEGRSMLRPYFVVFVSFVVKDSSPFRYDSVALGDHAV